MRMLDPITGSRKRGATPTVGMRRSALSRLRFGVGCHWLRQCRSFVARTIAARAEPLSPQFLALTKHQVPHARPVYGRRAHRIKEWSRSGESNLRRLRIALKTTALALPARRLDAPAIVNLPRAAAFPHRSSCRQATRAVSRPIGLGRTEISRASRRTLNFDYCRVGSVIGRHTCSTCRGFRTRSRTGRHEATDKPWSWPTNAATMEFR